MAETIANWMVMGVGGYLAIGLVFAPFFVLKGAGQIDAVAKRARWGFRLIIVPGVMAFWPLLAKRWVMGMTVPPEEKNPHRTAARLARGDGR